MKQKAKGKKNKKGKAAKREGWIIAFLKGRSGRLALILCASVMALAAIGFAAYQALKPMSIVGYGLSDPEIRGLGEAAKSFRAVNHTKAIVVRRAEAGATLRATASKAGGADIVCFHPGVAAAADAPLFKPVPETQAELVSMSLRIPVQTDRGVYALPLTVGHFELSYDRELFRQKGLKPPLTAKELEADAEALSKAGYMPIAFAGGDDESLLALASYFIAGPRGLGPYDAFCRNAAEGMDFDRLAELELDGPGGGFTVASALAPLIGLMKKGYVPGAWQGMKVTDVRNLVERGNAAMFMVFLSDHRGINASALERFSTIRFPSFNASINPSVYGPMLAAGLPASGGAKRLAESFLAYCIGVDGQNALCSASGQAPTVAAVSALDLQARDVRQWAIMSERIIQGPRADSGLTGGKTAALASALRNWLVRESLKK